MKTAFDPQSVLTEKEAIQMFSEGLRQAASRARQMGRAQEHPIWIDIAMLLEEMHNHGVKIAQSKAMSRQDLLQSVDRIQKRTAAKMEQKRPPGIIVN